jgi:hypothetical protein
MPLRGDNAGAMLDEPRVLTRIVTALEDSKIDQLTSGTSVHEGQEYSYHLKAVDYLGTLQRFGKRYVVATAFFLRSSAKGSEYPPARGHGFILILDSNYKIVSHGRLDRGNYYLNHADVLMLGDEPVIDFADKDIRTRYHGWLVDGFLPYPFEDRISEEDWDSGAFREKDKKK